MTTRSKRRAGTAMAGRLGRAGTANSLRRYFGGEVSTAERALISTAASLQARYEELEAKLLSGEQRERALALSRAHYPAMKVIEHQRDKGEP
jgi:hypothetical protein